MKKLLALLVALCMVLSLLPMTAMAACETCVDADGDYWCDECSELIEHTCVPYEGTMICSLCHYIMPHDCVDTDSDYGCDLCFELLEHECVSNDGDALCDYCNAILVHICADEEGDYYCNLCGAPVEHPCTDGDGDYCCDICDEIVAHDCFSEDGGIWCDVCHEAIPHDCADENGDYYCDLCYELIPHACVSEDGDAYCDLCHYEMEHDCIDEDSDYWCDLCGDWLEHVCADDNGDYHCDLCDNILEHDCVDADGKGRCDICDDVMPDHVHNYDTWNYNSYEHALVCVCGMGEYESWGEHLDEDGNSLCDVCAYDMSLLNIWVGGVQVNGANASDILGDGTASFDPATNTLTLKNANIVNGKYQIGSNSFGMGVYSDDPLNLVLVGDNTITTTDPGTSGMSCGVAAISLNVSGSGSLTVNVSGGQMNFALYGTELTIADSLGITGGEMQEVVEGVVALVPTGSEAVVIGTKAPSDPSNPGTGDSTPVVLLFGLMALSSGAVLVLGKKAYRV